MQVQGPVPPYSPHVPSTSGVRAPASTSGRSTPAPAAAEARPAPPETSLWDLLTPEEREFFTRAAELGPLSYRPGGASPIGVPLPTGQRIDVRG